MRSRVDHHSKVKDGIIAQGNDVTASPKVGAALPPLQALHPFDAIPTTDVTKVPHNRLESHRYPQDIQPLSIHKQRAFSVEISDTPPTNRKSLLHHEQAVLDSPADGIDSVSSNKKSRKKNKEVKEKSEFGHVKANLFADGEKALIPSEDPHRKVLRAISNSIVGASPGGRIHKHAVEPINNGNTFENKNNNGIAYDPSKPFAHDAIAANSLNGLAHTLPGGLGASSRAKNSSPALFLGSLSLKNPSSIGSVDGNSQVLSHVKSTTTPKLAAISQSGFVHSPTGSAKSRNGSVAFPGNEQTFIEVIDSIKPEDITKESDNDRILQERLQEAKALNRKSDSGAVMHKFSLWKKPSPPLASSAPISGTNTFASIAPAVMMSTNRIRSVSNSTDENENTIVEEMNMAPSKKSTRLRGPKAAREVMQYGLYSDELDTGEIGAIFPSYGGILKHQSTLNDSARDFSRTNSIEKGEILVRSPESLSNSASTLPVNEIDPHNKLNEQMNKQNPSLRIEVENAAALNDDMLTPLSDEISPSEVFNGPVCRVEVPDVNTIDAASRGLAVALRRKIVGAKKLHSASSLSSASDDAAVENGSYSGPKAKHRQSADDDSLYSIEEDDDLLFLSSNVRATSMSLDFTPGTTTPHKAVSSDTSTADTIKKIGSKEKLNLSRRASSPTVEFNVENTKSPYTPLTLKARHMEQNNELPPKASPQISKYQLMKSLKSTSAVRTTVKINDSRDSTTSIAIQQPVGTASAPVLPTYTDDYMERDNSSPLSELSHVSDLDDYQQEHNGLTSATTKIQIPNTVVEVSHEVSADKQQQPKSPITWKKGQAIGEGTFGKVYKGLNEKTGELLAIKQFALADGTEKEVDTLRKEISVMWNLDHENIVRYLGTATSERYLFIILEFIPGGSIASMLAQFGPFSENLIRRFSFHVLCGVQYLHSKGIIHRDIKGGNILVTDTGIAKLSDFGCSKQLAGLCTASMDESLRGIKGSVHWMAPEVIKQSGARRSSDIWSIGATIIEMASGKPPWREFSNNLAALFHVATAQQPPPIPVEATESCAELITMCMAIDPTQRSTADQLLEQSVFLQPLVSKRKAMSGMCSHPGNLPPSVNNVNSSESAISTTAVADDSSSQLTEDVQMTGIVIDKRAITDRNKNLEKNIANINSMKNPGDKTEEKIDLGSSYASIKSAFESSVAASSEDV